MICQDDITFNVIFVPGTVRYLHALTRSVINHSDCRFRLVANGCSTDEYQVLTRIAEGSSRVTVLSAEASTPVRHGILLDRLQRLEKSDTFAFMDSDIFATGEFLPAMLKHSAEASGIFSCLPLWGTAQTEAVPTNFRLVKGFHNRLADDCVVGSTYFAVYDNHALTELQRETNAGFEVRYWDELPQTLQEELSASGRQYVSYDTGKLINILLHLRGHNLQNVQCEALHHIGGVSLDACRNDERKSIVSRLTSLARNRLAVGLKVLGIGNETRAAWQKQVSREELASYAKVKERRRAVSRYLTHVMSQLSGGSSVDAEFNHEDDDLCKTISAVKDNLENLNWINGGVSQQQLCPAA